MEWQKCIYSMQFGLKKIKRSSLKKTVWKVFWEMILNTCQTVQTQKTHPNLKFPSAEEIIYSMVCVFPDFSSTHTCVCTCMYTCPHSHPNMTHLPRGWHGVGNLPGRDAGRWGWGFWAWERRPALRRSKGQGGSGWTPADPGKQSAPTAQMSVSMVGMGGLSALPHSTLWSHWLFGNLQIKNDDMNLR